MTLAHTTRSRIYIMRTYGSLMELKLRCFSVSGVDNRDFLYIPVPSKDGPNFKELCIDAYKTQARRKLGIDIWLPNPTFRHIYTVGEDVKDDFYWLHTARTNQHRWEYVSDYSTHTIDLEHALSYPFTPDRRHAIRQLMTTINDLNTSYR